MIKLYHFERSGNAREVRLVLHEKNLQFEEVIIDVMKGDTKKPDFLALNPFGKVPVLVDGDVVTYEAMLINQYLDEKYPQNPIMPQSPEARALVRQWSFWGSTKMSDHMAPVLLEMLLKPEEKWNNDMIAKNKNEILKACEVLNERLNGREYICDQYSLADICLTPHLSALGRIKFNPPTELTHFHEWLKRLKQRPNFKNSISH